MFCLFGLILYVRVNSFSVMLGRDFLGSVVVPFPDHTHVYHSFSYISPLVL